MADPDLEPPAPSSAACMGPYELPQLIGESGFDSECLAEQDRPVARRVGLKIIELDMDTRQVTMQPEISRTRTRSTTRRRRCGARC